MFVRFVSKCHQDSFLHVVSSLLKIRLRNGMMLHLATADHVKVDNAKFGGSLVIFVIQLVEKLQSFVSKFCRNFYGRPIEAGQLRYNVR